MNYYMSCKKEKLLQEQNELLKELVLSLEEVKRGKIKPFK